MALPPMTPEQRAEALAKAAEARRAQSALLAEVKAGRLSLAAVLEGGDETAGRLRLGRVIKALPGFGPVKVAAVLEQSGVDPARRVGGLTELQRSRLLAAAST